jgi:alkylation response protein AidB-like acyl-CoA dehydrogenase
VSPAVGSSAGEHATRVRDGVHAIAEEFAGDRHDRQRRRHLDPTDFARLAETGFLLTGVSAQDGGLFENVAASTRPVADILRALARGDASVALVSSMHPAVLSFWLASPAADEPYREAWAEQRRTLGARAADGAWFGTITSEPGSGGDIANTKAVVRRSDGDAWLLSGQKHFGSGSGVTSFMLTSARPDGEEDPDWFVIDVAGVPWDGSAGVTLTAEWDGHGMAATQSHGMAFENFPALRSAWPGNWRRIADAAGPFIGSAFTAVIMGIIDAAMLTARGQLGRRAGSLGPYERVEWAHAEQDAWLAEQAFEGMLRSVESDPTALRAVILGKTSVAELAESCLRRVTRIMGGGSYARHSPFGFWFEDVRALGWLRPPWNLAFDGLIESAWNDGAA